jgi:RNA polymerase sigma-70 factor (ECF subfamily)
MMFQGRRDFVSAAATSTFTLLEQARAGDRAALSRAFEKHQRRIAVLIYYRLAPSARRFDEVEDLVQETLLRACRDLNEFQWQSPDSFFRWLAAIAGHVVIDRARYHARERRAAEEVPFRSASNPAGPEPADTTTPSRLFARKEAMERLLDRLNALPDDYREALVMAKIEGLTTAEIAERMGRSRDAVALLVYRAVRRLRALSGESAA